MCSYSARLKAAAQSHLWHESVYMYTLPKQTNKQKTIPEALWKTAKHDCKEKNRWAKSHIYLWKQNFLHLSRWKEIQLANKTPVISLLTVFDNKEIPGVGETTLIWAQTVCKYLHVVTRTIARPLCAPHIPPFSWTFAKSKGTVPAVAAVTAIWSTDYPFKLESQLRVLEDVLALLLAESCSNINHICSTHVIWKASFLQQFHRRRR